MHASVEDDAITGINVTPMVDVILVLLIIFMATAPLLQKRALKVNIPKASRSERVATLAMRVEFDAKGAVSLDGRTMAMKDVVRELSLAVERDPVTHVSIAADKVLAYGEVVRLLDEVRGSGVKRVGLEVKSR